jgi:hypothetical protein
LTRNCHIDIGPTDLFPSSTVFACVRASSLGLAVSDLSWVYCWAAIWGNIELGFGILGAVSSCCSTKPVFHCELTRSTPEPRPLPHILGLLQTRPRHNRLQNPLHLRPHPPKPPSSTRRRLRFLRNALPPGFKTQHQTKPRLLQPPLIQHPHAQLVQIAHLGWLAQQILTSPHPGDQEQ